MNPQAYVQAWKKLKKHLEQKADTLPNSTAAKLATLAILFQMDIMEPEDDSSEDHE